MNVRDLVRLVSAPLSGWARDPGSMEFTEHGPPTGHHLPDNGWTESEHCVDAGCPRAGEVR
ncbi:hypothetical protein SAMN04487818_102333 [Actinokineospora terrae]|uniref:Uncharacterized protein n=1 Tax=Actinokineospora terrae TaxID=155974 RepID=A0A1H9MUI5_9PSEU|nr:hypothetical protein SAMN04487818_102333 [Actinokineospora terrae]